MIWPSFHNKILNIQRTKKRLLGEKKSFKVLENYQTETSSCILGQKDNLNEWQLKMNGTEITYEWLRFVRLFFQIKIVL